MPERRDTYAALYRNFRWRIPARFNIGTAIADRWAEREPQRTALLEYRGAAPPGCLTFGELTARSNALANGLRALGVTRGDRVAILLPQSFETVVSHAAVYKLGAITVPLSVLFGVEGLEYRLAAAGAGTVIADRAGAAKVATIRGRLPLLRRVLCVDSVSDDTHDLARIIAAGAGTFTAENTSSGDPAMMIFTSGTTGPPKGALLAHRVLLGHLPGIRMAYEFPPRPGDVMWTPADWAWAGGLLNALLPALYLGVPVVSSRATRFDPEAALHLVESLKVRNAFLPPTALRILQMVPDLGRRFRIDLRSVCSAGERLGSETFEWAKGALGVTPNEFYGQTEGNLVLGSCAAMGVSRAGATGKAALGHRVAIIDEEGRRVATGEPGQIAVRRPDPVLFLGYWQDKEATERKFIGDWMTTGDQGIEDGEGYFHFIGRDDDIITSAGFRIGPSEVEDCLLGHPAIALAAAVGKPDPLRTEIVKAYVVLNEGWAGDSALADEIKQWVRERLSAHEYPREVEFINAMPSTTSGKLVRRVLRARSLSAEAGYQV